MNPFIFVFQERRSSSRGHGRGQPQSRRFGGESHPFENGLVDVADASDVQLSTARRVYERQLYRSGGVSRLAGQEFKV